MAAVKHPGPKLRPGEVHRIYQKPLTSEDYEGQAKLIECLSPSDDDGLERWRVKFVGYAEIFQRTINTRAPGGAP